MVQHWSPMSEVRRTPNRGEWFMFDGATKIAIIRHLELGRRQWKTYRVVTYAEKSADRSLVGYFENLEMAAELTWAEYQKAKGVPVPPLLDVVD